MLDLKRLVTKVQKHYGSRDCRPLRKLNIALRAVRKNCAYLGPNSIHLEFLVTGIQQVLQFSSNTLT